MAPPADYAVTHRECLPVRFNFHGELRYDRAVCVEDFFSEGAVFGRIQLRQTGTDHCDGAPFGSERALMRGRVDPARQPADYSQTSVGDLIGKFLGRFRAVMGGAARTDDCDSVMVALS